MWRLKVQASPPVPLTKYILLLCQSISLPFIAAILEWLHTWVISNPHFNTPVHRRLMARFNLPNISSEDSPPLSQAHAVKPDYWLVQFESDLCRVATISGRLVVMVHWTNSLLHIWLFYMFSNSCFIFVRAYVACNQLSIAYLWVLGHSYVQQSTHIFLDHTLLDALGISSYDNLLQVQFSFLHL